MLSTQIFTKVQAHKHQDQEAQGIKEENRQSIPSRADAQKRGFNVYLYDMVLNWSNAWWCTASGQQFSSIVVDDDDSHDDICCF